MDLQHLDNPEVQDCNEDAAASDRQSTRIFNLTTSNVTSEEVVDAVEVFPVEYNDVHLIALLSFLWQGDGTRERCWLVGQ